MVLHFGRAYQYHADMEMPRVHAIVLYDFGESSIWDSLQFTERGLSMLKTAFKNLQALHVPIIYVITGNLSSVGLALCLKSDYRIASQSSTWQYEPMLDAELRSIIGANHVSAILATAHKRTALQGLACNLFNETCQDHETATRGVQFAYFLCAMPGFALGMNLRLARRINQWRLHTRADSQTRLSIPAIRRPRLQTAVGAATSSTSISALELYAPRHCASVSAIEAESSSSPHVA